MPSVLDLCNQALGTVGARAKAASLNDNVREAELCLLHYEPARDEVFGAAYWGSLRATERLSRIATRDRNLDWQETDPTPPWGFAYALPSGYLRARYLTNYVPFSIEVLGAETTVQTDVEDAIMVYTKKIEDPNRWEAGLFSLVVAVLALKLGRNLGVSASVYNRAVDHFQYVYNTVLTAQANMDHPQVIDVLPDWLVAREGATVFQTPPRFLFPTQALYYAPS